jgi:hypothetical protein
MLDILEVEALEAWADKGGHLVWHGPDPMSWAGIIAASWRPPGQLSRHPPGGGGRLWRALYPGPLRAEHPHGGVVPEGRTGGGP